MVGFSGTVRDMSPATLFAEPAALLPSDHPLWQLDDAKLGPFRLQLTGVRQLASSGWKDFRLVLTSRGRATDEPVLEGIHSVGGKGIPPWFDVEYRPVLSFIADPDAETDESSGLNLRADDLEVPLFRSLRQVVPANGHVSIAYETQAHRDTQLGLMAGVPPVATPLGWAVWQAGFDGGFKDWHISEGGHEGPKKLQANVPLDAEQARAAAAEAVNACIRFQAESATPRDDPEGMVGFWDATRARIEKVLRTLADD